MLQHTGCGMLSANGNDLVAALVAKGIDVDNVPIDPSLPELSLINIAMQLVEHLARLLVTRKEQGEFLSIVEETLGGLRVIKAFNAESKFYGTFKNSTERFFKFSNKLLNRQNLASPTGEFLGILVIGVLLWFGGKMVLIDKTLGASECIAYMGLAYNILTPAKQISKALYGVKKGNSAAERVLEILETKNPIAEKKNAIVKTNDLPISKCD